MVHNDSAPHPTWGTSRWQSILRGIVLIVAGLFVLRDAAAATVVSAIAIGVALLAAGLFESVQSFWAPLWGGILWRLVVGALYVIGGGVLIADPSAASEIVGILSGLVIFLKWSLSGLWVFGLAVGAALLLDGMWWVMSGWTAREDPRTA